MSKVDRALVDRCLDALVREKVVNGNYRENFRRHAETIIQEVERARSEQDR